MSETEEIQAQEPEEKKPPQIQVNDLCIVGSVINIDDGIKQGLTLVIACSKTPEGFSLICADADVDLVATEHRVTRDFIHTEAFKNRVLPSAAALSMVLTLRDLLSGMPVVVFDQEEPELPHEVAVSDVVIEEAPSEPA
jgi:hypothetical protein